MIEDNPVTKLSKPYQGKLLNRIRDDFTSDEQQLFVASFYLYLNYDPKDFIIDLDNIWQWLGFSKKDKAKRLLINNFNVNTDYKISLLFYS